ncbi:redox-sensitive bicupin YhaK, pirin superfamily [Bacteroidales bacterium 6E]|nr:redox-sensitive bicupin YhaK, pirin superfamily [Bacteroidales bacterium 6E]
MNNIELIIEERAASIGSFMVGRLLPFRKKRSVGPFVFMDHMGPAELSEEENLDVLPHPHIGLSTVTYLIEGAILHRDSLGSVREINPGAVNWMTAGKGIVHSERTPDYLRNQSKKLHGLQIWVGLPKNLEETEPTFHHIPSNMLPVWEYEKVKFKLIVGEALGKKSPVPVHSPMYFLELKASQPQKLDFGHDLFGESAIYILDGEIAIGQSTFGPQQLVVLKEDSSVVLQMSANTTIFIIGGEPFPEPRSILWNFVSSDKQSLERARENWKNQNVDAFPKVPGDDMDFVPMPEY